jgi:predicted CoA-binding protein
MTIMSLSQDMLTLHTWAVVGASTDKEKYGYKLYKKLKDHGYQVYPVNPGYDTIEGDKCYHSLSELPEKPEVIDMVVNPRIGIKVIDEADQLGIQNIWLQPGTHNDEIVKSIEQKGMQYVKDCVLVALG